jgi:hypothetical protein
MISAPTRAASSSNEPGRVQIERLAEALGVERRVVTDALYKHGEREGIRELVDEHFAKRDRAYEESIGDAWEARLGVGLSPSSARRAYAGADDALGDAWLARCGIE